MKQVVVIKPATHSKQVECSTSEKYAKHGGPQWRSPKYMILCGCDLAVCENHAKFLHTVNPFGPGYEAGKARKCRKHREAR